MYQDFAINAQKYWELDYYSCSTWDSLVASARECGILPGSVYLVRNNCKNKKFLQVEAQPLASFSTCKSFFQKTCLNYFWKHFKKSPTLAQVPHYQMSKTLISIRFHI